MADGAVPDSAVPDDAVPGDGTPSDVGAVPSEDAVPNERTDSADGAHVSRRRADVRWIVGAVAVLVAGLVVVITVSLAGPRASAAAPVPPWAVRGPTADDPFTRTPLPTSLECPATLTIGATVRIVGQVASPADHLVPADVPDRGLVCRYAPAELYSGPPSPHPLSAAFSVTGDLSEVTAALRAPTRFVSADTGTLLYACMVNRSRHDYLIGFQYDGGLVWFTGTDDSSDDGHPPGDPFLRLPQPGSPCDDHATNGNVSVDSFGAAVTRAVAAGRWEGAAVAAVPAN